jgi:hypothetical protein
LKPEGEHLRVDLAGLAAQSRRGGPLCTLSTGIAALTRGLALGRVAADLNLQLRQIGERVGLTAQLIGDHRWLRRNRGHRDVDPAALHGLD